MTINNFNMTKDQYDHIRHILITTPRNPNIKQPLFAAMCYLRSISKNENGIKQSRTDGRWYVTTIRECFDIVSKIQLKL
jgi:hypothetical protein